jgi:hypothetical protein
MEKCNITITYTVPSAIGDKKIKLGQDSSGAAKDKS